MVRFRTYNEVTGEDASRLEAQVVAQLRQVGDRLHKVRRLVAVASGKGGVGKSHLTAALARFAAARHGDGVGVLDADFASPTVAALLRAQGRLSYGRQGVAPVRSAEGVRLVSSALLLAEDGPLRWREPAQGGCLWRAALGKGVLREFLADVDWGTLDLMLVDLPPGVEVLHELHALCPRLSGVLAVTIPSEESRRSVARALHAVRDAGIPLLGIVENMSGAVCGSCRAEAPLFPGRAGERLAADFGIPLLGKVPFRIQDPGAPDAVSLPTLPPEVGARILETLP